MNPSDNHCSGDFVIKMKPGQAGEERKLTIGVSLTILHLEFLFLANFEEWECCQGEYNKKNNFLHRLILA